MRPTQRSLWAEIVPVLHSRDSGTGSRVRHLRLSHTDLEGHISK